MLGFSCAGKPKEKAVLFSFRRRSSGRVVAPRLTAVRRWLAFLLCIVAIWAGTSAVQELASEFMDET